MSKISATTYDPLMGQSTYIEDIQLIARLLESEAQVYKELVSTYQGAMRSVAIAIAGSRNCEDVVQDAWLSVVKNLGGFQGRSSLKTWLLTITANVAKARYNLNRREVLLDDIPSPHKLIGNDSYSNDGHWLVAPLDWHLDTPEALLTENELCQCLERTLTALPKLQCSVLILREHQGLELKEICSLLGISLSNVRVLLHRARLKVFSTIEHFERTGEC